MSLVVQAIQAYKKEWPGRDYLRITTGHRFVG